VTVDSPRHTFANALVRALKKKLFIAPIKANGMATASKETANSSVSRFKKLEPIARSSCVQVRSLKCAIARPSSRRIDWGGAIRKERKNPRLWIAKILTYTDVGTPALWVPAVDVIPRTMPKFIC
jgi:hypothetical protein